LPTNFPADISKTDSDLAAVVAGWLDLPEAIHTGY
jgi:hypothetical protein